MKRIFFAATLFFFAPLFTHAAADLRIDASDIRFSTNQFIAGDQIRIYSKVYNVGDEDVSGYVTFYQGAALIDESVVISLLAGGIPEEVYIDFIVPTGTFNIMVVIKGTDPIDVNQANDTAITPRFTPLLDDDRDGVVNTEDNCVGVANASQLNSDGDAFGDVCDPDDDNDGLSDDVEKEIGTSATDNDSDGDGVLDPDDVFPTDPSKFKLEEPTPTTVPSAEPSTFQKVVQEVAKSIKENPPSQQVQQEERTALVPELILEAPELSQEEIHISPNAVFRYQRNAWNSFVFVVLSPVKDNVVSVWDFGDGVTSSKSEVLHTYNTSGAFTVVLTTTDQSGIVSTERTTIFVPFFSLENRLVLIAVFSLVVLLIVGAVSFITLGKKQRTS